MKTYEKPQLLALTIGGSDMLCAGCTVTTKDNDYFEWLDLLYGDVKDGTLTPGDNVFSAADHCKNKAPLVDVGSFVGGYCTVNAVKYGGEAVFVS